jgi:2-polyprenyl-3-methyl-5-hydroxy-6-metoxy-1,4-benzoquinol methylase
MPIYSPGNAAKQWILSDIEQRFGDSPLRILDLACGSAWIWEKYISVHPQTRIIGVDMDAGAIEVGRKKYEGKPAVALRVFDAQQTVKDDPVDAVVALSAIEHVVDRAAFLRTVCEALRPGGIAYLNYDAGHFRSRNFKERLMVPVSQLLALAGYEKPYMKKVDDAAFRALAEAQGFSVLALRKHNLHPLKGFMRGAPDQTLAAWFAFEDKLGELFPPKELDRIMWSTTLVLKKV